MCWWRYLSLTLFFLFLLPLLSLSLSLFFLSFFLSLVHPSSANDPKKENHEIMIASVGSAQLPPSKWEPWNTKTMIVGAGFWFCRWCWVLFLFIYLFDFVDGWWMSFVDGWRVLLMGFIFILMNGFWFCRWLINGFCWWLLGLWWWIGL